MEIRKLRFGVLVASLAFAFAANASFINQTVVATPQSVAQIGTSDNTLHFIGNKFDPALGTLNSVSFLLTANLSDSTAGGFRMNLGSDPWKINWTYSGSVTLLGLSSTWSGSGPTFVNPAPFTAQCVLINLSAPASGNTFTSGLGQFIGNATFDLAAALHTASTWSSQPNDNTGTEFGNFNPYAGGTLHVTYDYTPVPEPTTIIAGALLLLPFGASTLRFMRKCRKA